MSGPRQGRALPPGRTSVDDAKAALEGAAYHLHELKARFDKGLSEQRDVNEFHWHLRGFFWELVAVRDSLSKGKRLDPNIEAALGTLEASDWFEKVNDTRNDAHQTFHIVEVLRKDGPGAKAELAQMSTIGPGDMFSRLRAFLDNMSQLVDPL